MVTRGIRAFVSRDWQRARDAKDAYWSARIRQLGAAEGFRVADELRRQALAQSAGWPDDEGRRRDLLDHIRLAGQLRRADTASRR